MRRERFPCHRGLAIPTCITTRAGCMPESLTSSFLWSQWREKRSRHSRRMRNPQFKVSGKRPIDDISKLIQVMAWCRQATSHCLNQICLTMVTFDKNTLGNGNPFRRKLIQWSYLRLNYIHVLHYFRTYVVASSTHSQRIYLWRKQCVPLGNCNGKVKYTDRKLIRTGRNKGGIPFSNIFMGRRMTGRIDGWIDLIICLSQAMQG